MISSRHLGFALELLSLPTSPCNEGAVAAWVERFVAGRKALTLTRDRWGNLVIKYPGTRGKSGARRPLVFCAHMDHPGFTATGRDAEGRVIARWMGGVPVELLNGQGVRFHSGGRWIRGRIVSVQPAGADRITTEVAVETKAPVATGSVGMWDFPDARLSGTRIVARGCDDVGGVSTLIALLDEAVRRKMPESFMVLLTRAEEWGFVGAIAACKSATLPAGAVVISVETSKELPTARQGDGPIIRVGDRTSIFSPEVTDLLVRAAEKLRKADPGFKYQRRLMDGGTCEATVFTESGYPSSGLCLALGNYHNVTPDGKGIGAEYIDARDFAGLVQLYVAAVQTHHEPQPRRSSFRTRWEGIFKDRKPFLG